MDIGSNSLRMMVSEVAPGSPPKILAQEREITRLGESVFRDGVIDRDAIGFVCGALVRMARTCRLHEVVGVRAVATAAVRDASNQEEFLENAAAAIGAPVEVVSGQEEARLIHRGVQSAWPHPKGRMLLIDVGGGSAEIILSENAKVKTAFSKKLGALRMTEVFLRSDPPDPLELRQLDEYVKEKIADVVRRVGAGTIERTIATSATAGAVVSAVNRIPRSRRETADRLRATMAQVRKLNQDLSGKALPDRRDVTGIGPRRAELIVAGSAVFRRIMEDLRLPAIHYSKAGVRDGVIADLVDRGVGRERTQLSLEQRRVVQSMARRYGVSVKHVRKVSELGRTLFESLQPLHKLPPEDGRLLEAAAYLHDIGHYVSDTSHHKHSAYLVGNSDMPGFTSRERRLISLLCRYHRRSMPKSRHEPFRSLSDDEKHVVTRLAPLLRLASSLDLSHRQRVEGMECQVRNGNVVVYLSSGADTDLDQWAGERAAEIFHKVYGHPLALVKMRRHAKAEVSHGAAQP